MTDIRPEQEEDIPVIRQIHEAAFGRSAEADLVDTLRKENAHVLSIVAVVDGAVVGHILFTPVTVEATGSSQEILGLGPMAVMPHYQRQGLGAMLIEVGICGCLLKGVCVVVVLGHPAYYRRFRFMSSDTFSFTSEFDVPPDVFMVRELHAGYLQRMKGVVKYHPAFRSSV
ncbi:MAG: N-acetyltransferase [Candidatus Omnitrophota bacterium]